MDITIHSRKSAEEIIRSNLLKNIAVISFYDPESRHDTDYAPVNYKGI